MYLPVCVRAPPLCLPLSTLLTKPAISRRAPPHGPGSDWGLLLFTEDFPTMLGVQALGCRLWWLWSLGVVLWYWCAVFGLQVFSWVDLQVLELRLIRCVPSLAYLCTSTPHGPLCLIIANFVLTTSLRPSLTFSTHLLTPLKLIFSFHTLLFGCFWFWKLIDSCSMKLAACL